MRKYSAIGSVHSAPLVTLTRRASPVAAALLLALARAGVAGAQVVPGDGSTIGSERADRARLAQIIGDGSRPTADSSPVGAFQWIRPTVRIIWNSAIPAAGNDGALWAGRGVNAQVATGVAHARAVGRFRLDARLEPEITYSRNDRFFFLPGREPGRSSFSSPWHLGESSADLPLRFGDRPIAAIGLGQTSLTFSSPRVAFGASTANEWWGPARRNTLVLSNQAGGIPRLFVRTARPLRTGLGEVDARLMVGGLTESPYFDYESSNDVRSVNGALVTLRPAIDSGLTLGVSRLVIAPAPSLIGRAVHATDVFFRWSRVASESEPGRQTSDQILSFFARWVFPASGFEAYAEWARTDLPYSIRDFLVSPQHSRGYTLGLQWASAPMGPGRLRLSAEATNLEQTRVVPTRPPIDYYAGRAAAQGFTQRGQVLGAAVGPGGSSQYVAAEWTAPRWSGGAFLDRVRSENDALYRQIGARLTQHDVTVQGGARGSLRLADMDAAAELTTGVRYNYLFESDFYLGNPVQAVDLRNVTLRLVLSPR